MSYARPTLALLFAASAACNSVGGNPQPPKDMAISLVDASGIDLSIPGNATACAPRTGPVTMSTLPGDHQYPRIGYTGSKFVVGWNTQTFDPVTGTKHRIDTQLVDSDGNKLGPNLPLSPGSIADDSPPAIAPVPEGTTVAWVRTQGGLNDVVLSTVDNNGQKLSASGTDCPPDQNDCGIAQITQSGMASFPYLARPLLGERTAAPTDTVLTALWLDTRNYACEDGPSGPTCLGLNDVFWKKTQANGVELVPERRLTPVGANRRFAAPRMAFDGVFDGVVYRDDTNVVATDYYFTSVDGLGLIATSPTKIGSAAGKGLQIGSPDLVWNTADYALVSIAGSQTTANVVFQRLATNGATALVPRGVSFDGVACTPAVAWNEDYYAVAWQTDCNTEGSELAFVIIDKEGIRQKADGTSCFGSTDDLCGVQTIVPQAAGRASYPELVWAGGHNFGLTWMERTVRDAGQNDAQIMFTEIDCVSP